MRRFMPIFAIILLLAAGGAAYLLTQPKTADTTATTEATPGTTGEGATNLPAGSEEATEVVTITYTGNGFSPASITVKSGQQITVVNNSGRALQLSSDPHPTHTQNSELNQSTLASGRSQTFTVTETGTWGYHNHLDDSDTGEITVQ